MNRYEQKQAARRERMEARAAAAQQESEKLLGRAHSMADMIPFGQPILCGHHSEGRDRNYRKRIQNTFSRGFEAMNKAEHYQSKAASVGTGGISSDDPDAIEKLREKLANLEQSQQMMKAANSAIRKHKGDEAAQVAALIELGFTEAQAREAVKPDFAGRVGFASYSLTNNNANIKRVKDRIAELEKKAERQTVEVEADGYTYREDTEENRVMFIFDGKPSEEIRGILKMHAFKWSPSRGAWVRQLTGSGQFAASRVRDMLRAISVPA